GGGSTKGNMRGQVITQTDLMSRKTPQGEETRLQIIHPPPTGNSHRRLIAKQQAASETNILKEIGRGLCLNKWKRSQVWRITRTWQVWREETSTMVRKQWMLRAVAQCDRSCQRASQA